MDWYDDEDNLYDDEGAAADAARVPLESRLAAMVSATMVASTSSTNTKANIFYYCCE